MIKEEVILVFLSLFITEFQFKPLFRQLILYKICKPFLSLFNFCTICISRSSCILYVSILHTWFWEFLYQIIPFEKTLFLLHTFDRAFLWCLCTSSFSWANPCFLWLSQLMLCTLWIPNSRLSTSSSHISSLSKISLAYDSLRPIYLYILLDIWSYWFFWSNLILFHFAS